MSPSIIDVWETKTYNGDVCHSDKQDEPILRNLKIVCPKCKRQFAALLSKYTKLFGLGPTAGEESPKIIYKTMCYKCKTNFAFGVEWD